MSDTKEISEVLDPAVEWGLARFNESKEYYSALFDKFQDWDDLYFSIPEDRLYDWQSNVFVPAIYKAVKTLLARVVAATYPQPLPFDVVGVEEKDKPGEPIKKRLVSYQFDKTNMFEKWVLFILQAMIRGTSIGKVSWKRDVTYVPVTVEYDDFAEVFVDESGKPLRKGKSRQVPVKKQRTVYQEKILYEGPDFEVIDILGGFFVNPYDENIKIHRVVRTADYLRKNAKHYSNLTDALASEYPGDDDSWKHSRLENIGLADPTTSSGRPTGEAEAKSKTDEAYDKYELLEIHCPYDINDDGKLEDSILTICNRKVLLRKSVNKYPDGCFVKIGFMPVLNEFYWQGVCELCEPLQLELNDKRNQRLDNVNLVLQTVLAYLEDAIEPEVIKNFVFKPGGKLPVKDINAIQWVQTPDVTNSSYNEEKILISDIQETSGAVNVLGSNANTSDMHRTASGLFMLKGEAETSLKLIVQLMETMGLAEIAKKYDILNQHFMTRPQQIRILGEGGYEYLTVNPLANKYYNCDFIFKGASSYVNREIRMAQLTKMMDIIGKVPQLANQFDPQKLVKILVNTLGFDENEVMRQMIPIMGGAGMIPALNQNGLGGQSANVGMAPQEDFALQRMVNEGLPMESIRQQMAQMRGGA